MIPNKLVAWQTVPGSAVSSSGTIHFDPTSEGGTRVQIKLKGKDKGQIVLGFDTNDDFERLLDVFRKAA